MCNAHCGPWLARSHLQHRVSLQHKPVTLLRRSLLCRRQLAHSRKLHFFQPEASCANSVSSSCGGRCQHNAETGRARSSPLRLLSLWRGPHTGVLALAVSWLAQQRCNATGQSSGVSPASNRRSPNSTVLLSALALPFLPGQAWADLTNNYIFMVGFWGWFIAQFMKIFTRRAKTGVWDVTAFTDSGGMPSSHSSLCMAVTTAVAMQFGLGSSLFAVSLCFSLIVMYDAAGVRRHAGMQAEVLNVVLEALLKGHAISETKLKEVLGHTPLQVAAGATLGVLTGLFYPQPTTLIVLPPL